MTIKTLLAAAALAFTPMLATAQCSHLEEQTAMSCAEGYVHDAETNSCVVIAS